MTRNQRRQKAKMREVELKKAVSAAFEAETARIKALSKRSTDEYPTDTGSTVRQKVRVYEGKSILRHGSFKLIRKALPPIEPLEGDWRKRGRVKRYV